MLWWNVVRLAVVDVVSGADGQVESISFQNTNVFSFHDQFSPAKIFN